MEFANRHTKCQISTAATNTPLWNAEILRSQKIKEFGMAATVMLTRVLDAGFWFYNLFFGMTASWNLPWGKKWITIKFPELSDVWEDGRWPKRR